MGEAMSFVVIIPSKTVSNLIPCMEAIWENEAKDTPIVVVDDGLKPTEAEVEVFARFDKENHPLWISSDKPKPFIFSAGVNKGIRKAGDFDVCITNDDALLQTPGGFSLLQQAAEEHPEYGIIAATTNVTGNPNQKPKGIGLREENGTIPFICVYVPRRTIDAVGLMDERFGGTTADGRRIYGFCDNDMCRRVKNAGLKLAIHDGCYVDHASLRSSFRGDPHAAGDISAAKEIYLEKWGSLD